MIIFVHHDVPVLYTTMYRYARGAIENVLMAAREDRVGHTFFDLQGEKTSP